MQTRQNSDVSRQPKGVLFIMLVLRWPKHPRSWGFQYHRQYSRYIDSGGDDGAILLVVIAHAAILAQEEPLSDDLKVAFRTFLAKVEENWLEPPNEEPNTPLGRAYFNFWMKYSEQCPERHPTETGAMEAATLVAFLLGERLDRLRD